MNQFFKFVFASCIGVALALVAISALGFFMLMGLSASGGDKVDVKSKSVLHITLNDQIPEQTNNVKIDPFAFSSEDVIGLNGIVASIEHAAEDEKVEGIFLDLGTGVHAGLATSASIRQALVDFKESEKFIVAYSKYYSQGSYYLASVADKVYMSPVGAVDLHGFGATLTYFKGMMDKLGVRMQVFYAGNFKSATEPYRRTDMSEANRLQMRQFIEPAFNNFLSDIGRSRNKSVAELRKMADELRLAQPKVALANGMVDELGYIDNVIADIKERIGLEEKDKLKTVSLNDYAGSFKKKKDYKVKDKIAVIYAEGAIYQDQGDRGNTVDNDYMKILRKVRKDDKIKAIVLRVNSPGGSAIASENIWRELVLAKEAGKPLVVSMGDYAASGGYYIACMADKIYAEPNTLTGSIGVFSMIPNMRELYNDKLGITFDTVKTAKYSTGLNVVYDMDDYEKSVYQNATNELYETFLKRVGDGRDMSRDDVHEIAQGRVWIGGKAKEIGLVDEIGNIDDAIAAASELAGLEKYRITEYPKQPDPMQEFINELTGQNKDDGIKTRILQEELGEHYEIYRQVKEVVNMKGVQARLPFVVRFN